MLLNILLGLLCLSIVVIVHETGHFLAAKGVGITVEVFSIGWGKPLLKTRRGETEYALSPIPLGGYCKMKGEALFRKAVENNQSQVDYEEGSLFSVGPWKRILTYVAGPAFNFIFAVVAMTVVFLVGFSVYSYETKIVLLSEYPALADRTEYPADRAGLKTGDTITAVNGKPVKSFSDFQSLVAPRPEDELDLTVMRDGQELTLTVRPDLDKETGAGVIGVSAWVDPVIGYVAEDGSARAAGIETGDRILSVGEKEIVHHLDFYEALKERQSTVTLEYRRNGELGTTTLVPLYREDGSVDPGLAFAGKEFPSEKTGFFGSLARGTGEAFNTFYVTLKSIGLFFRGLKPGKVISGPIRITVIAGEIATEGFAEGFKAGVINLLRLMSLFSVALCFMNLLPIPALDGGMILINLLEAIKGRSVSPKFFYRYQMVGVFFILLLLFFATFSDITFLSKR
ncbi:MAG: site-2 protease family protein [Spirochaetales bacterium]|nr:site-2 protease family protein [Spirochaetales bacterium]